MVSIRITGDELWRRMERAEQKIRKRLTKIVELFESAAIPYAVVGDDAVRVWVAQVDEAAVRNTKDVDILVRRADFSQVRKVIEAAGLFYRETLDVPMFLDAPDGNARDAVHIIFAGEMVRQSDPHPNPDIEPFEYVENFRTLQLDALVRMKLNSFRLKDRVHLVDMIDVGLIDASWLERLDPVLQGRLKGLLENLDA